MAGRRRRNESYGFRPYVPAAERKREGARVVQRALERGQPLEPVNVTGHAIATTPWGRAWCDHIESFQDYSNRLPRGRTYVRNGSVVHLELRTGEVHAHVMGSSLYRQRIEIAPCAPAVWKRVRRRCAGNIGSLIELLEGRLSREVMAAMTAEKAGLLPDLGQVAMGCTCPDWAFLCKHLAAVLYGVGARLDERPELLFLLRGVDPAELIDSATLPGQATKAISGAPTLEGDLAAVFGIELDDEPSAPPAPTAPTAPARSTAKRKVRRQALLQRGVPAGTIATWLRQGILRPSADRGVYLHTPESRARLTQYGG